MTASSDRSNDAKFASIGKDISYIQKDIAEIKTSIKELAGVYVTQHTFDNYIESSEKRFTELENSSNLWKWLSPILAATFGSILTFLIIAYLQSSQ